jgi:hypothetical protein
MRFGLVLFVVVLSPMLSGCGADLPVTAAISGATGLDCSVAHLNEGQRFCRPRDGVPETPLFCTRSLGVPDCWRDPSSLPNKPREIADGPRVLTPEQEKDRTSGWPGLW